MFQRVQLWWKSFFLEFLKVDDTTGMRLFGELQEVLVSLELDIGDLRGQWYDNGSNMKGKNKGVQTRVLEFLFCIAIWYNLLFAVNSISKLLQSEDMDIDVVKQLKGLITYFERYREIGFVEAMVEAKEMASEMRVEPSFVEKRIICRKKQFDKDVSEEVTQSVEESFRVNYFLYIVDKCLLSLKNRFE